MDSSRESRQSVTKSFDLPSNLTRRDEPSHRSRQARYVNLKVDTSVNCSTHLSGETFSNEIGFSTIFVAFSIHKSPKDIRWSRGVSLLLAPLFCSASSTAIYTTPSAILHS